MSDFELFHKYFTYDPKTGHIIRILTYYNKVCYKHINNTGRGNGYITIKFQGKQYSAHRVAWLLMVGKWPDNQIDHINGIRNDNRWCNLREATSQQQNFNRGKRKSGLQKYKGISWCSSHKKYKAVIGYNGIYKNLGRYDTPEEAHEAYCRKAQELFGEFWRDK